MLFIFYTRGIDSFYVDGISLIRGGAGRRQHIWTFAAGLTEVNNTNQLSEKCPCDIYRNYDHVPAFVGNDYFCESGLHSAWNYPSTVVFYLNDVLWDGQNCTSTSTCCQLNNPPWLQRIWPMQQLMTLNWGFVLIIHLVHTMMIFPLNSLKSTCSDIIIYNSSSLRILPIDGH